MSAPYTWAPRSGPDMLRILIADDHDVVRSGLRSLIESQTDWEVVAEVADGREAVSKAIDTRPDVAVLDYSMPLINGAEVTRQIRARLPRTEVLIFTIHDDEMLVRELLCAGARGYVLKSDSRLDLLSAIESVAAHKAVFTTKVAEVLLASFVERSRGDAATLSDRERGVVQLIAEGHTNKEVATILNMSLNVVETQRASLMRKLDLASSAAIVRYAIRNGLIEP